MAEEGTQNGSSLAAYENRVGLAAADRDGQLIGQTMSDAATMPRR